MPRPLRALARPRPWSWAWATWADRQLWSEPCGPWDRAWTRRGWRRWRTTGTRLLRGHERHIRPRTAPPLRGSPHCTMQHCSMRAPGALSSGSGRSALPRRRTGLSVRPSRTARWMRAAGDGLEGTGAWGHAGHTARQRAAGTTCTRAVATAPEASPSPLLGAARGSACCLPKQRCGPLRCWQGLRLCTRGLDADPSVVRRLRSDVWQPRGPSPAGAFLRGWDHRGPPFATMPRAERHSCGKLRRRCTCTRDHASARKGSRLASQAVPVRTCQLPKGRELASPASGWAPAARQWPRVTAMRPCTAATMVWARPRRWRRTRGTYFPLG